MAVPQLCAVMLSALSLPTLGGPEIVPVAAAVSSLSLWLIAAAVGSSPTEDRFARPLTQASSSSSGW